MINPLAIIGLATCLSGAPATAPAQPKPVPHHGSGTVIVKLIDISATTSQANETNGEAGTFKGQLPARTRETKDIVVNDTTINKEITKENAKIISQSVAEATYEAHKAILNERFANMFEIKKELDANSSYTNDKWNEYHLLRQAYEQQLKKIIADWVTDMQYEA